MVRAKLGSAKSVPPPIELNNALASWPVVSTTNMPDTDTVLVHIPSDLAALKKRSMAEAIRFRQETRTLFTDYINKRGFLANGFVSAINSGERASYYILTREES